jgi:hypothetical protein
MTRYVSASQLAERSGVDKSTVVDAARGGIRCEPNECGRPERRVAHSVACARRSMNGNRPALPLGMGGR